MKSFVVNFIVGLISVFFLSGCGPKLMESGVKIDANQKSIFIGGTGYFTSVMRKEFENNGWYVTTQSGHQIIAGRGAGKYNYKTRYSLAYKTWVRQSLPPVRNFEITIVDNYDGKDVVTFSENQRGFWANMSEKEVATMVIKWINKNLDKSKLDSNSNKSFKEYKVINNFEEETILKDNKFYAIKSNTLLDGNYESIKNDIRIVYTFSKGLNKNRKYFNKTNNLVSEISFENGFPSTAKTYYTSGLLESISKMYKGITPSNRVLKDGIQTVFYENGSKKMELNWNQSIVKSGYIYSENGTKEKMTEAHFYNFGLKK